MTETLTKAEQTFALRMVPHIERGLSFEDAARAVLRDDARICEAALYSDAHLAIQTYDGAKPCSTGPGKRGAFIRSELSREVYEHLRAEQP